MITSCKSCRVQFATAVLILIGLLPIIADEPTEAVRTQREALSRFQNYVGEWRGVAQPRRGSSKEAWIEECQWAWDFHDKGAALSLQSPNGKYVRNATLRRVAPDKYELIAKSADNVEVRFSGGVDGEGSLVLLAEKPSAEGPSRVTVRVIAGGDRLIILYERRTEGDRFNRLAEVGFTRKGSGFGLGTNYIECVVTGGVGTIPVTFEGETYHVCCTGCRDYFNDNPAEVLAEYRARKAEEKKKKGQRAANDRGK